MRGQWHLCFGELLFRTFLHCKNKTRWPSKPPQDREGQLRGRGDAETLGYRPQATCSTAAILLCCAGCREEPLGMGGACSRHAPEELAGGVGWLFPPLVPPAGALSFGCGGGWRAVLSLLGTESVTRGFQRSSGGGGPLLPLSSQPRDQ